jgi:hypothetical protein
MFLSIAHPASLSRKETSSLPDNAGKKNNYNTKIHLKFEKNKTTIKIKQKT